MKSPPHVRDLRHQGRLICISCIIMRPRGFWLLMARHRWILLLLFRFFRCRLRLSRSLSLWSTPVRRHRVLLGFTGFYRVLLGFTGFLAKLRWRFRFDFHRFLPSFAMRIGADRKRKRPPPPGESFHSSHWSNSVLISFAYNSIDSYGASQVKIDRRSLTAPIRNIIGRLKWRSAIVSKWKETKK